ncbi:hypothetical protein DA075_19390 [Methylobacterium currus]|uniref:Glycosyltransferase family 1 protein n=1 Tax=Methylobacterium currus TaxID=2051553 RepID=A0A2R4WMN7_9HYPH|nr:glycosyltransferase family 4 protein [Methylobacterium currus]AWB22803.1 hypothetical protein DA075_19390 [Methylobacterium currus]UHC17602.1 glycosyltransferase family 4 protein [Methylobacterium currus]
MPRRLKVATIVPFLHIGGDENRLLAYLAARNAERFDHIVISGCGASREMDDLWGPIRHRFAALDVPLIDLGLPYGYESLRDASAADRQLGKMQAFARFVRRTARLLRERDIDVVDGRGDTGTVVAALAARLAGTRAVVSTNYFPQIKHAGPRSPAWHLFRGVYGLVDAVVCDSQTCLDAMRRWMLFAPPGHCIPNGIEPPLATRPAQDVAAELGVPAGATVIGQIARIQPYKGQELLLEAASRVMAEVPNALLLLCGYPSYNQEGLDYRDRLIRLIAAAGMGDRVRLAPYPGPIGDVWPLIDIHAHPTLLDSSPIALLEGMSVGKPAVTTRIGGIHELVLDGETGIVLPQSDAGLLADALLRLLRRPDEAARLGRNARSRYAAGYTSRVMAGRIEDLFEQVHASPRGRISQAA